MAAVEVATATASSPPAWLAELLTTLPDFSRAGYRAGSPLPSETSQKIVDVTAPPYTADPSGQKDSTSAIQRAIDDLGPGGGVVFLPAGVYRLECPKDRKASLRLVRDGVVLRGAGPGKTFLLDATAEPAGKAMVQVGRGLKKMPQSDPVEVAILAPDRLRVPGEFFPKLQIGDWVAVQQLLHRQWLEEFGDPSWHNPSTAPLGPSAIRQITDLHPESSTVLLDLPIPTAVYRGNPLLFRLQPPVQEVGLENFSLANCEQTIPQGWGDKDADQPGSGAARVNRARAIQFLGVAHAWVRGVASFRPTDNTHGSHLASNGIELRDSRSVTLQEVRLSHPQYGGEGGNGYLFSLVNSSDCLLLGCSATFSRHGFSFAAAGTHGNVLHRCRDSQTGRYVGSSGAEFASGYGSDHHRWFSHQNLIDQCVADRSFFAAVYRPFGATILHGVTAWGSIFWNVRGEGEPDWPVGLEGQRQLGDWVVASEQGGSGLIVGTSGPRSQVRLGAFFSSGNSPVFLQKPDRTDWLGQGEMLHPASLYQAQRQSAGLSESESSDALQTPTQEQN